jgi:hypothetical protein
LTIALVRHTALHITGDVSRYLPAAIWSDGSEGKDQVIYASAASAILLPLIVSAITVCVFKQIRRALQTADKRDRHAFRGPTFRPPIPLSSSYHVV